MPWYVYIATAHTGRYYVGITTDPEKRIEEHNTHSGSQFARMQGPFLLSYVSSAFPDRSQAHVREIQIKGWSRWKKEKLISGEWQ
jgi:predicted GIY-YIG superfamily endonuclease